MNKLCANLLIRALPEKLLASIFILSGTTVGGISVYAQSQGETSAVEEVVVTATKREESLGTVGISVTALQGEELQARGAVDFEDYAVSIPNLSFGITDDGILASRSISIRGIQGLNTTGFYIDDIPIDETIDPLVLDVERIEVLRGPQGTLFGARGLGGTIRIITKKPEFDVFSARLHSGVSDTKEGDLNSLVNGVVNLPLADNLAARITAYYQGEEGIFDRVIGPSTSPGVVVPAGTSGALTGGAADMVENVDDKEIYGGQVALRFESGDDLSFLGRIMYQRTEIDGFPLADSTGGGNSLSADDFTQERLFNIDEGGEDEWSQFAFNVDYQTDLGLFSSSTGYLDRDTDEVEDSSEFISFTLIRGIFEQPPTAVPSPIYQLLEFNTFVQEIRFISDFDGPVQATAGIFYQETDDDQAYTPENIATGFGDVDLPLGPAGALINTGSDLIFTSDTDTEIEEFGLFGELSYALNERLVATFGARYFDTETTTDDSIDGFAAGGPSRLVSKQSEDGFNLKGALEYEVNDHAFLYTSVSEGFRIGGANRALPAPLGCPAQATALGFSVGETRTYDSDSLLSYEIGAKTNWLTPLLGPVTLNAALFYIDFDDIQQRVLLGCGFDFIVNLGAAESRGLELEMMARPTDNLAIQAALGYTDAEFTETVAAALVSDGDPLQQVPEYTFSSSIDYSLPLKNIDYDWFTRLDFSYVDNSVSTVNPAADRERIRPSYSLLNLRLGLENDTHKITFFVDNLFDRDVVLSDNRNLAAESSNRPRVLRNRPRTLGIDFRINF